MTKRRITTALAVFGLLLGGAGVATAAAPQAAAAECSVSVFRVSWNVAGVYKYPDRNGPKIKNKYSGDRVTGPTGGTGVNFTQVYVDNTVGYMDKDAVQYVGCE